MLRSNVTCTAMFCYIMMMQLYRRMYASKPQNDACIWSVTTTGRKRTFYKPKCLYVFTFVPLAFDLYARFYVLQANKVPHDETTTFSTLLIMQSFVKEIITITYLLQPRVIKLDILIKSIFTLRLTRVYDIFTMNVN